MYSFNFLRILLQRFLSIIIFQIKFNFQERNCTRYIKCFTSLEMVFVFHSKQTKRLRFICSERLIPSSNRRYSISKQHCFSMDKTNLKGTGLSLKNLFWNNHKSENFSCFLQFIFYFVAPQITKKTSLPAKKMPSKIPDTRQYKFNDASLRYGRAQVAPEF